MNGPPVPCAPRTRHLLYFATPSLWPVWPFLPVIRRTSAEEPEYGLLYDIFKVNGRTGFSATVFLCNLFLLPESPDEFLALPKWVYDRPEELYEAGWRID